MTRPAYFNFKNPLTAQLEITHACTHDCFFCYNPWRHRPTPRKKELTLEEMTKVLDRIIESEVFEIVFTGGEPLARKDILFKLVEKAKKADIVSKINSNIYLLTSEDVARMKDLDVDGVLASIASLDRDKYKNIMGVDALDQVTSNLEMLLSSGIPCAVNMVVNQRNKGEVYSSGKLLHDEFGLKFFCATPMSPCSKEHKKDELNGEEIEQVLIDLKSLRRDCGMKVDTLEPIPFCLLKNPEDYTDLIRRDCSAGRITVAVSPEGEVRPCTHVPQSYGSLMNEGMKEIWSRMNEWRDGSMVPEKCEPCAEVLNCSQGCRESSRVYFGKYGATDPWVVDRPTILRPISFITDLGKKSCDDKYYVDPRIRFRAEEDNYVIFSPSSHAAALVNKEFLTVLSKLRNRGTFNLSDVASFDNRDESEKIERFLGYLRGKGFLLAKEVSVQG